MKSDEIRRLVREAITEALGSKDAGVAASVTISTDAELNALAREIATDPKLAKSIAKGKVSYSLAQSQEIPTAGGGGGEGFRWLGGVLNETKIIEISKTHSRILLGRGAVVTPLARDKARDVKLELVKERS